MVKAKLKIGLLTASSGLSLLALSAGAMAQDAARTDRPAVGIADIVVTAQKRSENVQDVPASVTAIGQEALELRQISSVSDLQSQVPSLVVGNLFGTNLITLRGISTGLTSGTDDPSIATHIDGAYQPRSRSIDVAMVDLERVEVLAGPQGTLYGRNATGGAVNYVLRGPSDKFEGEITGRVGNYDRYGVAGSVSGPLSDTIGVRITGLYDNQSKGFTKVLNANAPRDSLEEYRVVGGRAVVEFKPTDRLTVSVEGIGLGSKSSTSFFPFAPSLNAAINAASQPQSYRAHETYTDVDAKLDSDYYQAIGTINWDLTDEVSLKSITAYQDYHQFMVIDSDGSATAPFRGPTTFVTDTNTFTQEFNLNASLFDDRLKSILGFFYYDDKADINTDLTIFSTGRLRFSTLQKSKSYAVFTDHTFSITPSVRLIAGIRFNHDEKSALQSFFIDRANGTTITGLAPTLTKASFESWTPRLGIQVDLANDVMAYAQYSKGFKSGGFASQVTAVNPYDPEKIKGGEVGIKSDLANGRIRLNVAGYYYDYSDLQVQNVALINGVSVFQVRNAAASRIYGVEAQFQAVLTDGLKFDAAGMVQSAKYTDFTTCNNTAFLGACGTAATSTFVNVKGNWLNRAPNYTVNVGLEYEHEFQSGAKIVLRGESYFSGNVYYDEFATPLLKQGAYSLQNAFVSFSPASDKFTLRAFIKNIADTKYKTSGFFQSSAFQQTGTWGAPRTFGAEATLRF
ncbi:TonB-dependent receptor [Sphingobium sp. CR2-8]|uniref:TonB-dependent receptor n=1 Tax=Sphingobium sp. CR2-8 TaxID=1306534 RepID=UPI002DB929F7|nr:TonB-dependent receptor [Sphingobium sp. CR2-8]MEC3909529.1 TonB-dependent receptor [Sphingobium sp. CR2-8]